jgi:hypothetical protein
MFPPFALAICVVAACKGPEPSVAIGLSRDQLIRHLGAPTTEAGLSDGSQVLQYEFKNLRGGVACIEQYVLSRDAKIVESKIYGFGCR